MSFVDSLDSVLMLYAYASPSRSTPEGKIGLFQSTKIESIEEADLLPVSNDIEPEDRVVDLPTSAEVVDPAKDGKKQVMSEMAIVPTLENEAGQSPSGSRPNDQVIDKKTQVISSLSVTLTALSIIVALR